MEAVITYDSDDDERNKKSINKMIDIKLHEECLTERKTTYKFTVPKEYLVKRRVTAIIYFGMGLTLPNGVCAHIINW